MTSPISRRPSKPAVTRVPAIDRPLVLLGKILSRFQNMGVIRRIALPSFIPSRVLHARLFSTAAPQPIFFIGCFFPQCYSIQYSHQCRQWLYDTGHHSSRHVILHRNYSPPLTSALHVPGFTTALASAAQIAKKHSITFYQKQGLHIFIFQCPSCPWA